MGDHVPSRHDNGKDNRPTRIAAEGYSCNGSFFPENQRAEELQGQEVVTVWRWVVGQTPDRRA